MLMVPPSSANRLSATLVSTGTSVSSTVGTWFSTVSAGASVSAVTASTYPRGS